MKVLATLVCVLLLTASCGGDSEPDRAPILVQGNSVSGERVLYRDLASTDTFLWFWAPW